MQNSAITAEHAHQAMPFDFANLAVLPRDFRLLQLHHPADRTDQKRRIAIADRRQAAEIGHDDRSFIEPRRLRSSRNGGRRRCRLALCRFCGHLFVQLLELGLVAKRDDHLRERPAQDADFVPARDVRLHGVVAGGHCLRRHRKLLDRPRDALCDQVGEDERQQQRRAAAEEKRLLDLAEGRELAFERADEHRSADRVASRRQRLPGHDVPIAFDLEP